MIEDAVVGRAVRYYREQNNVSPNWRAPENVLEVVVSFDLGQTVFMRGA